MTDELEPFGAREDVPRWFDLAGVIDQPAGSWQVSQWFNSPPLSLEQLRGNVVFVRWFMGPSCPFCSATAPTLRRLHERFAAKGLVALDPGQVEGWIRHFGYRFPVAIDKDWTPISLRATRLPGEKLGLAGPRPCIGLGLPIGHAGAGTALDPPAEGGTTIRIAEAPRANQYVDGRPFAALEVVARRACRRLV